MNLPITYPGKEDPFEGDRTLWFRGLPDGARVLHAQATLTPIPSQQQPKDFLEMFAFERGVADTLYYEDWGVLKSKAANWVEVDFNARRELAAVRATLDSAPKAKLLVDMGGAYVEILESGAIKAPGDSPFDWPLSPGKLTHLPGVTANKFKFKGASYIDLDRVQVRSLPTNVSLRVGELAPFWTHLGELAIPKTSPDFAEVLNAFLLEAGAKNGFYAIPFVIHSDSIARLDVTLAIDYVVDESILPPHLPEVTLTYGYGSLPHIDKNPLMLNLPRGASVVEAGGAVLGTFDATRVVHDENGKSESEATGKVTVTPDRTLAQPIRLGKERPVTGIDLPLANTEPGLADLHLALQEDVDGKPSGTVLINTEVQVERLVPDGSAWGSAALPSEFRFLKDRRYWLVLQSVSGDAHWEVAPGDSDEPALQSSTDGGFSWRTATSETGQRPLAALYRLRHTPERYRVPIQLQVGEGRDAVPVRFDRFAPLGRVEFDVDFAAKLEEYLASPSTASPCGSGNLLTNGDFADPVPRDDATRKLFGFDAKRAVGSGSLKAAVIGNVDLSGGITLQPNEAIRISVDSGDPVQIYFTEETSKEFDLAGIADVINQKLSLGEVAQPREDKFLALTSPSTGAQSRLVLLVPNPDFLTESLVTEDATKKILGITPPAHYQEGTQAQIVGIVDLSEGVDLSAERFITLSVDGALPVRIDCAGRTPARTQPGEIVTAINKVTNEHMDAEVAHYDDDTNALILTSPTIGDESVLELHACKPSVPDGWRGIRGQVLRYIEPETGRLFTGLLGASADYLPTHIKAACFASDPDALRALTGEVAVLSQRVPVRADCLYLLHFCFLFFVIESAGGLASRMPTSALVLGRRRGLVSLPDRLVDIVIEQPPRWEIEWLDADGLSIGNDQGSIDVESRIRLWFYRNMEPPWFHKVIVTAPSAAVQAEIRFEQPPPGLFFLSDVSLAPTSEMLRNGDFQEWSSKDGDLLSLVTWKPMGGMVAAEVDETKQVLGVRLRGDGSEDTVLAQRMTVVAEERYELQVRAWPVPPRADDVESQPLERRARLELRWLADGDEVGKAVILPLDGRDFPIHAWTGTALKGATHAEVRLVQPQGGGNLVVSGVSLRGSDLASVPLTFLAEAPGELTVSDLRVAYQPPQRPEEALPGVPGWRPPVEQPEVGVYAATAVPPPPPAPGIVVPSVVESPPLLAARAVGDIKGVGSSLETSLINGGIATIGELAAADLAESITGVTSEQLLEAKAKAELILSVGVPPNAYPTLVDESLKDLLLADPDHLAANSGCSRAEIDTLQRRLRGLRLHFKSQVFEALQLSDLITGGV